jgi:hypothetical protein
MSLPITPGTKVGALLEAYPALEELLIACAPAFAKLRNPMLRRTVAKVATLEQAARVGGIRVHDLVRLLREAAGQTGGEPAGGETAAAEEAPAWVNDEWVRFTIDADAMLETGVHPIGKVRACAGELQPGELLKLTSSFRPEPLLETMRRAGLAVFCAEIAPGRHATYMGRLPEVPAASRESGAAWPP